MVFKYLQHQTLFFFNDTTTCNESDLFIISTKQITQIFLFAKFSANLWLKFASNV